MAAAADTAPIAGATGDATIAGSIRTVEEIERDGPRIPARGIRPGRWKPGQWKSSRSTGYSHARLRRLRREALITDGEDFFQEPARFLLENGNIRESPTYFYFVATVGPLLDASNDQRKQKCADCQQERWRKNRCIEVNGRVLLRLAAACAHLHVSEDTLLRWTDSTGRRVQAARAKEVAKKRRRGCPFLDGEFILAEQHNGLWYWPLLELDRVRRARAKAPPAGLLESYTIEQTSEKTGLSVELLRHKARAAAYGLEQVTIRKQFERHKSYKYVTSDPRIAFTQASVRAFIENREKPGIPVAGQATGGNAASDIRGIHDQWSQREPGGAGATVPAAAQAVSEPLSGQLAERPQGPQEASFNSSFNSSFASEKGRGPYKATEHQRVLRRIEHHRKRGKELTVCFEDAADDLDMKATTVKTIYYRSKRA